MCKITKQDSLRLFIAAFLPTETKQEIIRYAQSLQNLVTSMRWEPLEKLHITLRFLGEVDHSQVEGISQQVGSALCGSGIIDTGIGGYQLFPTRKNPRVFALTFSATQRFGFVFAETQCALAKNGFSPEKRKFVPHVTIGRIKGSFTKAWKIPSPPSIEFCIDEVGLVQSHLNPRGSSYTVLRKWKLSKFDKRVCNRAK